MTTANSAFAAHSDPLGIIDAPPWHVEVLDEVVSTNALVAKRAEAGAAPGLVIIADHQTAGRGRRGNRWEAPYGTSLLLSALVRPDAPMADWPRLTIATAVAVCECLEQVAGLHPRIKWPNDVLLDDCKIAGILLESRAPDPHQDGWIVVGIGINIHTCAFPETLRFPPTSVKLACGYAAPRAQFASVLLHRLHTQARRCQSDWSAVLADFATRDAAYGRRIQVETHGQIVTGIGAGLAIDGSLLVRIESENEPHALRDAHSLVFLD